MHHVPFCVIKHTVCVQKALPVSFSLHFQTLMTKLQMSENSLFQDVMYYSSQGTGGFLPRDDCPIEFASIDNCFSLRFSLATVPFDNFMLINSFFPQTFFIDVH